MVFLLVVDEDYLLLATEFPVNAHNGAALPAVDNGKQPTYPRVAEC